MLQLDNPLWQFSLRVYGRPGVAAECLDLQRAWSLNVNLLLFGCWIAVRERIALSAVELESIEHAVAGWHARAVLPLRAIRDDLKRAAEMRYPEVELLRKQVLASELRAEQIEQALIFEQVRLLSAAPSAAPLDQLVAGNIALICSRAPGWSSGSEPLSTAKLLAASLDDEAANGRGIS